MATGRMTKLTDMASTAILTAPSTREAGKKINNTVKVSRPGPTVPHIRERTSRARSMVTAASPGQIFPHTLVTSLRTTSKDEVSFFIELLP